MVGWHHWLNGHEFEEAPGVGGGRKPGMLQPWGRKELNTTELNWTNGFFQPRAQGRADSCTYKPQVCVCPHGWTCCLILLQWNVRDSRQTWSALWVTPANSWHLEREFWVEEKWWLKSKYTACVLVYVCVNVCTCILSRIRLFAVPWTVAHQVPLSMEFSRQDYWSG